MKKYTDTALHAYFAGNLRVQSCDNCCSRWYFKFNGAECSSPGSIDGAFFMWHGRKNSLHRHRHIAGHCNNIHKGKVRVGFWVGNCAGQSMLTHTQAGIQYPGSSLKKYQKRNSKHMTRDQLDFFFKKSFKDKCRK